MPSIRRSAWHSRIARFFLLMFWRVPTLRLLDSSVCFSERKQAAAWRWAARRAWGPESSHLHNSTLVLPVPPKKNCSECKHPIPQNSSWKTSHPPFPGPPCSSTGCPHFGQFTLALPSDTPSLPSQVPQSYPPCAATQPGARQRCDQSEHPRFRSLPPPCKTRSLAKSSRSCYS